MLRVICWRVLSKVVETRYVSRLAESNYRLNGPSHHVSGNNLSGTVEKEKSLDFSKSVDEEKLKVREPTKKPDTESNEDEKLVTKASDPTNDDERGIPPWLTKVTKCQEIPLKGMNTSRHVDWEKCVNFCFVI